MYKYFDTTSDFYYPIDERNNNDFLPFIGGIAVGAITSALLPKQNCQTGICPPPPPQPPWAQPQTYPYYNQPSNSMWAKPKQPNQNMYNNYQMPQAYPQPYPVPVPYPQPYPINSFGSFPHNMFPQPHNGFYSPNMQSNQVQQFQHSPLVENNKIVFK